MLITQAAIAKHYKNGWLKQETLISHSWRLEVQDQGVSRVGCF